MWKRIQDRKDNSYVKIILQKKLPVGDSRSIGTEPSLRKPTENIKNIYAAQNWK